MKSRSKICHVSSMSNWIIDQGEAWPFRNTRPNLYFSEVKKQKENQISNNKFSYHIRPFFPNIRRHSASSSKEFFLNTVRYTTRCTQVFRPQKYRAVASGSVGKMNFFHLLMISTTSCTLCRFRLRNRNRSASNLQHMFAQFQNRSQVAPQQDEDFAAKIGEILESKAQGRLCTKSLSKYI